MDLLQWVNALVVLIGIPAACAALIKVGRKLEKLDHLEKTTGKIKANVKVISDHLIRSNADFNHTELQSYSPYRLTPQGKNFIKQLGFDVVFSQNKQEFYHCIDQEKPEKKYDVELAAIKSISLLLNKEYMGFLKEFFYNNPTRNLPNTAPTLGVYVRDKYLEDHPQIEG